MSESLKALTGEDQLYFYDAIAPIVHRESIDMSIAFRANRYDRDEDIGDYLNCPFTKEEYLRFREALQTADRIELRGFESAIEKGVDAGKEITSRDANRWK